MDNTYIQELVMDKIVKQDDEDGEDKFDSDNPLEWYEGVIRDVYENEEDNVMVSVRTVGGKDTSVPFEDIMEEVRRDDEWEEEQVEEFEDQLLDMVD